MTKKFSDPAASNNGNSFAAKACSLNLLFEDLITTVESAIASSISLLPKDLIISKAFRPGMVVTKSSLESIFEIVDVS